MLCYAEYKDGITNSTVQMLQITMTAENAKEGFRLGIIAMQLRQADIWCAFDDKRSTVTVIVKR